MKKDPHNLSIHSEASMRSSAEKQNHSHHPEKTMDLLVVHQGAAEEKVDSEFDPVASANVSKNEIYQGINQILIYKLDKNPPIYYVPCYLRMRIQRVSQINYIESKAEIEAEIRIWVMLKQFPSAVQEEIINLAKLEINEMNKYSLCDIKEPGKLDHTYIKNNSKKVSGFMLSEHLELNIESNPFWSPYELVKLNTSLELKKITLGNFNEDFWKDLTIEDQERYKGATIEFNFLDAHPFLQFSFGEVRNLGAFDIAESLVDMKFSNESIKEDEEIPEEEEDFESDDQLNLIGDIIGLQGKVKREKLLCGDITPDAYEHGQILIPLYKYPSTTIINVFVPFYMVAIMNLGVFFEANDMSNRNASLATFQLAYIAFFPTIRQNLPETPKLVFAEILIYLQALCTIICFIYSLVVNGIEDYVFVWNENRVFLLCLSLTIINVCVVVGMFLAHKLVWERRYNTLPKGTSKYLSLKALNTDDYDEWYNRGCEEEFSEPIEIGLVKPMFPFRKKKEKDPVTKMLAGYFKTGGGGDNRSEFSNGGAKINPLND